MPFRRSRAPFSGRSKRLVRPFAVVTAAVLLLSSAEAMISHAAAAPGAAAAPAPPERVTARPDRVSALSAARAQGARVKVENEGSAKSETFANPDGSLTAETYGEPSFRRDGDKRDAGRWVPLSAAISGAGTAADPFVAGGLARKVTIGRDAASLLAVDVPGGAVTFSAAGVDLGAAVRSGSTVRYPDAAAATDLELAVTPAGVKTNLVLKGTGAPTSFRFHLSDPRGLVGAPDRQPDGSYVFSGDLGDGYRLGLAPATAYVQADVDGLGTGVDPSSATQVVTRAGDGWDIVLAVAPAWLTGKAFPIVLDPSPVFVAAGSQGLDCHIASGTSATTSYCSAATRDIGLNLSKVRRTLAMFNLNSIPKNAAVSSADLDLYLDSTEAATGPIAVRAYRATQGWNSGATWNSTGAGAWTTAGGTHDTGTVLASGTIGLTAGHQHLAVSTAAVQNWVKTPTSGGVANYGMLLRATTETTVGVLRFASGLAADLSQRPRLTVTYNTAPPPPMGRTVAPCSSKCDSPVATSSATPRLTAHSIDPDGGQLRYDFEVWAGHSTSPTVLVASGSSPWTPTGVYGAWTVPAGVLSDGQNYEYRVKATDGIVTTAFSAGWVQFTVDTVAPTAPVLTSTQYSDGPWNQPLNGSIAYTSTDSGTGVWGYSTKLDDEEWSDVSATATRSFTDLLSGRHTFAVRAQDKAGSFSAATTWSLGVNFGGLDTPKPEDRTAARVLTQASAAAGHDWLTLQYRIGTKGTFTDLPLADVTVPGTSTHPAAWPVQRSAGVLPPLVWDVGATVVADGPVQIRGCFLPNTTFSALYCVSTRTIQLARSGTGGSYATTGAGPGTVSLLTGDASVDESDVDVPSYNGSLSIGRTLTTLTPSTTTTGATGIFGPAWTASLPGPEAGSADLKVEDHNADGYVTLIAADKTQDVYTEQSTTSTTATYTAIGDAAADGSTLVRDTSANTLTLTELDGTQTVWTLVSGVWVVTRVTEPGASTTSYTRDGAGRVTDILAPVPAGVTCTAPLTTPGCRSLKLTYATATTATGTAPAQWGDYLGRLAKVDFTAYNPATSTMATVSVSQYSYDSTGMLRAQWDPRISPALKTTYDYGTGNRLTTVTPPGLSAWTFGYDGSNRLTTVSRPNPSGGTATTTVRYGVPFTGAGAPVELGKTETDTWGQADLPTVAAAVWGPDRVPAATPTATDWLYAELTYLNVNGRPVNTASWGESAWQVTATEYDQRGNTVRSLSAGNRNDALAPAGDPNLDPYVASIPDSPTRARLLSNITRYTPDGVDELESLGPMHPVVLDDGSIVSARAHTTITYDQGAPPSGGPYRLPTTGVSAAQTPDGLDRDARTTRTGYDPVNTGDPSGWTLRQATSTTTDMPGAIPDIVNKTRFNAAGQTIETRMPSEPSGGGPGTSITTYYTATGTGICGGKPHWAGLTCQDAPASQPSSGPALPVTTTSYAIWDAPTAVTETAGTTTRTTTTTFDGAGRSTGQTIAVTPAGAGGTDLPAVTNAYDPATGLPTTTTTPAGVITIGYDTVGQATSYTQTSGGTTITAATRTYDIAGRVATAADGKGTTTYTYDTSTDHRGLLMSTSDTLAGSFTATYNADGKAKTVTYPGGLTATSSFDNDGNTTDLVYAKSGTTWLTFEQTESIHGQVRINAGPIGEQLYTYDAAARLTRVDDHTSTAGGTPCTRRDYTFDANTNRTGLTTTPATTATGSATDLCDITGAASTTVTSTYDTADRSTTTGSVYDTLGRTTTVPAAAVLGGANLVVAYHTNDLVQSLTQGTQTKTYTLDPARRILTTTDSAGPTLTNHYTGSSDNPDWIGASDGTWTRNVGGPAGGLAAVTTNTGAVELQLANLHGDIVATAGPGDTAPASYNETTEYGTPRDTNTANPRYGYLGSHQRNTGDALAQITLMGVRLYNPNTGRFLSVDPVPGGSANAYEYAGQDPVNKLDLDGRCWQVWQKRCRGEHSGYRAWKSAAKMAVWAAPAYWVYRGYKIKSRFKRARNMWRKWRSSNYCRGGKWHLARCAAGTGGVLFGLDDFVQDGKVTLRFAVNVFWQRFSRPAVTGFCNYYGHTRRCHVRQRIWE